MVAARAESSSQHRRRTSGVLANARGDRLTAALARCGRANRRRRSLRQPSDELTPLPSEPAASEPDPREPRGPELGPVEPSAPDAVTAATAGSVRDDDAAAPRALKVGVVTAFVVLFVAKCVFAARTNLYFDESYYWQCGQRLQFAYSDHPFMTALLVRAGTTVFGDTTFGVRALFLLAGATLPFAVWNLARPIVGERRAWMAAGLVLVTPILALQGMIAVPDAVMAPLAALAIAAFERATRMNRRGAWVAAGVVAALGFCTHYRFVIVVLAAGAYLVLTRAGRARLRTSGPWIAAGVAVLGLTPVLLFNLQHDFAPIRYQFVDRHAAGAKGPTEWPVHLAEQAAVMSPILYVALLAALVAAWRRARAGDDRSALLATFATVPIATYFVTSPWAGDDLAHFHWPSLGYIPLSVCLAAALDRLAARDGWRRLVAGAVPATAALATCTVLALAVFDLFSALRRYRAFVAWPELAAEVRARLPAAAPGARPVVLADSYIQASQIDFALRGTADVLSLDHPRNASHGRALQYRIWGLDEAGLRTRAGRDLLVVVEASEYSPKERAVWMQHVRRLFEGRERVGTVKIPTWEGGDPITILFLTGRVPAQ